MSKKAQPAGPYPTQKAALGKLRPTQMAVGYAEVALKRREWLDLGEKDTKRFLRDHQFPAVLGPKERFYIVDHHHLGRALLEEAVKKVHVAILADLSHLAPDEFWIVMDQRQWVHPYDQNGKRRDFSDMPDELLLLPDDPYRSLAAEVRRAGDYPKDSTPFSEFLWADFFRRRIPLLTLHEDPDAALKRAEKLAVTREASHLPDWGEIGKH